MSSAGQGLAKTSGPNNYLKLVVRARSTRGLGGCSTTLLLGKIVRHDVYPFDDKEISVKQLNAVLALIVAALEAADEAGQEASVSALDPAPFREWIRVSKHKHPLLLPDPIGPADVGKKQDSIIAAMR